MIDHFRYRELHLEVPEEVVQEMKRFTGAGDTQEKRKSAFDVIQSNPKGRITSWLKTLDHSMVKEAEQTPECSKVLQTFSKYYKPISELVT